MMTSDRSTNHHYVPRFMIRNFTDPGKNTLNVITKRTGKKFTPVAANLMTEQRFHEFFNDSEERTNYEPIVTEIENIFLHTYTRVVEQRRLAGDEQERTHLALLMAFQLLRTNTQRRRIIQANEKMRARMTELGSLPEIVELFLGPERDPADNHLRDMMASLEPLANLVFAKDLRLEEPPPGHWFYLGDNPLITYHHDGVPIDQFALAVKGIEVYLPLSRDLMLSAWCPSVAEFLRDNLRQAEAAKKKIGKLHAQGRISVREMAAQFRILENSENTKRILHGLKTGTPYQCNTADMETRNVRQMLHARRHVICPFGDYEIAERFIRLNPDHDGLHVKIVEI